MPAVVGFVAGIGAAAASAVGIGLVGIPAIVVGSAVLALTLTAARRYSKLDDPADANYYGGMRVTVASTEAPRNIAYGEVMVGGVLTYTNSAGPELRSLYFEIVHVGHEIDCEGFWIS